MLAANGTHSNGNGVHAQALYQPCSSDYEPCPLIDVVPSTPKPGWRENYSIFTHVIKWLDTDSIEHSMTLRNDNLADLMADLKLIKNTIKNLAATQL